MRSYRARLSRRGHLRRPLPPLLPLSFFCPLKSRLSKARGARTLRRLSTSRRARATKQAAGAGFVAQAFRPWAQNTPPARFRLSVFDLPAGSLSRRLCESRASQLIIEESLKQGRPLRRQRRLGVGHL